MKTQTLTSLIPIILLVFFSRLNAQDEFKEFQVKRKNVFEFTKEPTITKSGDSLNIEFSVKDYCDVTIAIENQDGNIVRHLASGVLGENAPLPFKKNSLEQKIIWDSKDDKGKYFDDLKNIKIRVSLGLKPIYEKDLYHSSYKRISGMPTITTSPEGLYVFEGHGRDQLRLFSHKGEYIKTIYPFPASQIKNVKGIDWASFASREKIPTKYSAYHQTLLSSGDNGPTASGPHDGYTGMTGKGATTIAVQGNRILLAMEHTNRIQTDGSTGGQILQGPAIGIVKSSGGYGGWESGRLIVGPSSSAFSPDGKTVYFTGFLWHFGDRGMGQSGNMPVVMKLKYESNEPAKVFAGKNKEEDYGSGPDQLNVPTSVDTDTNGNVYVSDFCNDRIQIFDPDGKLLKSLNCNKPAKVLIHKVTNEVYVFSYPMTGIPPKILQETKFDFDSIKKSLTLFNAFPELKNLSSEEFPIGEFGKLGLVFQGNPVQIALDSWSKNPAFWVVARKYVSTGSDRAYGMTGNRIGNLFERDWLNGPIRRIEKIDSKWVETDNFGKRAEKDLVRPKPGAWNIQQLYVNPKNKKLYVGEAECGPTFKNFKELLEVDTDTGITKRIKLPFAPMDIAFDLDGLIYMRSMAVLGRYNMENWKEIPFDYGEEKESVGGDAAIDGNTPPIISGIMLPATNAVCYHQGGMDVNANGDILVACHNRTTMGGNKLAGENYAMKAYTAYKPMNYPGRLVNSLSVCLHAWDKHGKVKFQDILPGCPQTDGVFLDTNDNVYIMATPGRTINKKSLDDGMSATLMKFKVKKGSFLTSSAEAEIPLPVDQIPNSPQDLRGLWAFNYDWIYGGVGFSGFNSSVSAGGCACWFARFKLDYFARSFAPEPMQYSVAVLDSNGNLITRIGQYGNVDSAGPKSKEPLGGDEVGLFHPCFVGTLSDKKLFISDIGNERILSVKLGYNNEKILPAIK